MSKKGKFPPSSAKVPSLKQPVLPEKSDSGWGTFREIVESVAIALVIAFLFRTFVAEMFMIPTGSMAPTLMGQHKDLECPQCGHVFQVGASVELRSRDTVVQGTCQNCGYTVNFQKELSDGKKYPSYSGDRIVVGKYPYRLTRPERWDVAVFLCPGNASQNYIKRVVGLPGETLKIWGGDVFISPDDPALREPGQKRFRIARKPAEKILATMLPVYDNNCQSESLRKYGWPARWSSTHRVLNFGGGMQVGDAPPAEGSSLAWQESPDGKAFLFAPADGEMNYGQLEYRHYLPQFDDWKQVNPMPGKHGAAPRLITDMVSYNTGREWDLTPIEHTDGTIEKIKAETSPPRLSDYGYHWVGDLILECKVEVLSRASGAKFAVGLTKGGHRFWCDVNLETGEAELSIPSVPDEGDVPVSGMPGKIARMVDSQWMEENERLQRNVVEVQRLLAGRGETGETAGTPAPHTVGKPPLLGADRHSGVVSFPPAPRVVGHREAVIPDEVVIRDVRTGRPDTMLINQKFELPVYEYITPQVGAQAVIHPAGQGGAAEGEFYTPRGQTSMNGANTYHIRFANVDNQLHLWVNGQLIRFDLPTAYGDLGIVQPMAEDLRPAIIKACCAKVRVSELKLFRDIYYIAAAGRGDLMDFPTLTSMFHNAGLNEHQHWRFYSDPRLWRGFQNRRSTEYKLENGQYFMMGDNSAASSDCRIWGAPKYVREELLIGEAYYVYWPHPWNGFVPNFPKMRKIR